MTTSAPRAGAAAAAAAQPAWLTPLLATACGLIVANLYYAQPLVAEIAQSLGIAPGRAGLVVTMAQLGYGLGLLFLVPLGDLVENRRLIVSVMGIGTLALLAAALSQGAAMFLVAALFVGLGSVSVQVIVPYAAQLAAPERRGAAVGNVMSGLMIGIMMSRPVASFLADLLSWHAVFLLSAVAMVALAVVLRLKLPTRQPAPGPGYGGLLASMVQLLLHTPVLQRRANYQACLFGAFSLFWTVVPLQLKAGFGLSQSGIALFALAGVTGAIAAPIAGRMADRGLIASGTLVAILAGCAAFVAGFAGLAPSGLSLALLVAAAVLIDFGVAASLVLGQRQIYALGDAVRARLNGLFMALFFMGGAAGSALGGWAWSVGGWAGACWAGLGLTTLALVSMAGWQVLGRGEGR